MDAEQQKRFDELKAKADGPGLTADEADELGKLYAAAAGAVYSGATDGTGAADADEQQEEDADLRLREQRAADQATEAAEGYRSQVPPGEGIVGPE
jgi:hypothetical protein